MGCSCQRGRSALLTRHRRGGVARRRLVDRDDGDEHHHGVRHRQDRLHRLSLQRRSTALGAGCPLPLGGESSGTVDVMGSWQAADSASLSNTFVDASAGTHTVAVVNATNLTVSQSTDSVSVRYTWQDVNVKSGATTLAAQSSWTVNANLAGTPGDPSDDSFTIDGARPGRAVRWPSSRSRV